MTVLEQMALASKKGGVTNFVSTEVHDRLEERFIKQKKVEYERQKAEKLEKYFNRILKYLNKKRQKDTVVEVLQDQFVLDLINLNILPAQLFDYSGLHNTSNTYMGELFEKDLAVVVEKFLGKTQVTPLGQTKTTNKYIFNSIQDLPQYYLEMFDDSINEWIKVKTTKENRKNDGVYRLVGVQGKIDLKTGNRSNVNFKYELSSETKEFIQLLSNLNISAKNYLDISSIHLGSSHPFRAIASVMAGLNYQVRTGKKVAYACISNKKSKNLFYHKYHLQFAYELSGIGQLHINNNTGFTDRDYGDVNFLFVFDRAKNSIRVISVADLINKALNTKKGNSIQEITINLTSPNYGI